MKTILLSFVFLAFSQTGLAMDVIPTDLRDQMVEKAKKRVYSICGSKENSYFPTSFQVHDTYLKRLAEDHEEDAFYYYAPRMTGAAFCKDSKHMIQWTTHSDMGMDGEPEFSGMMTTVTKVTE